MEETRTPVYGSEIHATVILFKPSGKYYCQDSWRVPTLEECLSNERYSPGDKYYPYVILFSPDFRMLSSGGAALVVTQEPWGHPWLFTEGNI